MTDPDVEIARSWAVVDRPYSHFLRRKQYHMLLIPQSAKFQFVDLAWAGLRKGFEKFDPVWDFVIDQPLPAVTEKILCGSRPPPLQNNESDGDLAAKGVLHTDGRDFERIRMAVEHFVN